MIDKQLLAQTVEEAIAGTRIFLVDVQLNAGNSIVVEIDSEEGIDIDTCADITRKIESVFDRDAEDYELEVGSAGLTSPFKVRRQYEKNVGQEVEVLTRDGRKLHGTLTGVGEEDFTIEIAKKVKEPGAKRPTTVMEPQTIRMDETKHVKCCLKFS